MNTKLALTLAIAAVLLLALLPAAPQAQGRPTGFIISNADAVTYLSTTVSTPLNGLIAAVAPRFVIEHANDMRDYSLPLISSTLTSLMAQVGVRFVVEHANDLHYYSLPPISSTLTALLAQVGARFVLDHANANRYYTLTYPTAMIGDATPPQISTPPAPIAYGPGSATIQWITNEFATTVLKYGDQPGVYSHTVTDTLYFKLHEFTLTGLTPGQRYYYRATHTDRSGNVFQSVEYFVDAKTSVYLPLVRK